ncbi:peptidase C14 caspase catalytic subunit p20 [Bacillus pseudomycoides]|nr:peptidase C14 caspase catalytic subunit p20 [Bacillus pseudomycoides]
MSVLYRTKYANSRAIIIGINSYKEINNLGYACNDAEGIKDILISNFEFPEENITMLLNEEATKSNIMSEFMKLASDDIEVDDRVLFFYAGHGHTIPGKRGDIGFLVPHEGTLSDLSTLIRWDDLTRGSELIRAKHILFIMDACYSGLAITRTMQSGSVRFLKDMLRRNSRQVLTAGKANEVVADSNGPIPGHSIFTGHLIQGLQGNAANTDGIVTANSLMTYVYEKVSRDEYSQQTPHYGFIDGDGDFIFAAPILKKEEIDENIETDYYIEVPSIILDRNLESEQEAVERIKEYLSNPSSKIKLDDMINNELRSVIAKLNDEEAFSNNVSFSNEVFLDRLQKYEEIIHKLALLTSCLTYWGQKEHAPTIKKIITRLGESVESKSGYDVWNKLKWYPIVYLIYCGGMSAIANENYELLAKMFNTKINEQHRDKSMPVFQLAMSNITEINDAFKSIPGHERQYVPRSEYLYKSLQPAIDDLFYIGKSYEVLFDKFEILLGWAFADEYYKIYSRYWGPIGRFGWKYNYPSNVYKDILEESNLFKEKWDPIEAGLFNSSYERFSEVTSHFEELIKSCRFN